jgi:hypothetical protein
VEALTSSAVADVIKQPIPIRRLANLSDSRIGYVADIVEKVFWVTNEISWDR